MTYHPNDLRDAVDALTQPEHVRVVQVIDGTTYTRRLPQDPLLLQLENAIHGTMRSGSGASSNLPGETIPLDGDALYRFTTISTQITDWCRIAGLPKPSHPVGGLRAWHAATLATLPDPSWHVITLRGWASLIRGALNPRRRRDLPDPCTECSATSWADEDGNSGLRPLVVSWQPDAADVLATAAVSCRACRAEWRGITAVRAVAWALEHRDYELMVEPAERGSGDA